MVASGPLSFAVAERLVVAVPLALELEPALELGDSPFAAAWKAANDWSVDGLTAKTMPDLQWVPVAQ